MADSAKDIVVPDEDQEGPCEVDFGKIAAALLPDVRKDGRCLRCGHLVVRHQISAASGSGGDGSDSRGARLVVVNHGSAQTHEQKKLAAYTLAQAMVRSVRSSYAHNFILGTRIHLSLGFRAANALHDGVLACPVLVVGQLPERMTKEATLQPWDRMVATALVIEAWLHAIIAPPAFPSARTDTVRHAPPPYPNPGTRTSARDGGPARTWRTPTT